MLPVHLVQLSRHIVRSIALLVLLAGAFGVAAQPASDTPLILVVNGIVFQRVDDIFAPYNACQPDAYVTGYGATGSHGRFAFTTQSLQTKITLDTIFAGEYIAPTNLWMCDTATDTLTQVASQADDFVEVIGELPTDLINRTRPEWSSDGNYIAWTEIVLPEFEFRVGVYDVTTGVSTVSPLAISSEEFFGIPSPPSVYWVGDDVVMLNTRVVESGNDITAQSGPVTEALRYDTQANLVGITALVEPPGISTDNYPRDTIVVVTDQGDSMAFDYDLLGWYLVDVVSGQQTAMVGQPELVSRDASNGLVLQFNDDEQIIRSWQVQGTDIRFNTTIYQDDVAISPDGSQVAVAADQFVNVYSLTGQTQVQNSYFPESVLGRSLIWGDAVYRISASQAGASQAGAQQADTTTTTQCEGTQVSRLREGFYGRVTDNGFANNLRSEPSLTANLLAQIPPDETFAIITGPVCAEGYAWWEISYQGQEGWTAEGNDRTYWLEPYNQ